MGNFLTFQKFFRGIIQSGGVRANSLYLMLSQVFRFAFTLALMALMARYLGVAKFGSFAYALAFCELFLFLADFGLPLIFIRETVASRDTADVNIFYSNALVAQWVSVVATYLLIFLLGYVGVVAPENQRLIQLLGLGVAFNVLMKLNLGVFRVVEQMQFEALAVTLERLFTLILVGICVWFRGPMLHLAMAWVLGTLGGYLATIWLSHHFFVRFQWRSVSPARVLTFFRQAYLLTLSNAFSILKERAGIIILQVFAGNVAVGLFSAAYRITIPLVLLAVSFQSAIIPVLVRLAATSPRELREVYRTALRVVLVMGFILQALVMYLSPLVIPLLYGREYLDSIYLCQLLSLTLIPLFGSHLSSALLVVQHEMRPLLWCRMAMGLSGIILSLTLCGPLGPVGLAWALICSEVIFFVGSNFASRTTLDFHEIWSTLKKCAAAILCSGIIFLYLKNYNIPLASISSGIIYVLLVLRMRTITLKEIMGL